MSTKNTSVTASNADADISLGFFLAEGGTYPADLMVRLVIKRTDNMPEVVTCRATEIPRTLSNITAQQAANFLKDCRNHLLGTVAGYT